VLRNRKQRQRAALAGIVVLATLLSAYFVAGSFFGDNLQAAVYDNVITGAPAKVKNQITIIALDDATVARYGRWPVPRQAYIDLLNALRPFNAKAIAFDVAFYDPSDKPDQDKALAAAIKDAGNVYLAMQGVGVAEYRDKAQNFPSVLLPLDMFREAAAGLGAVNVNAEFDARIREIQLIVKGPDAKPYYALALVASARHLGADLAGARVVDDRLIVPAKPIDRNMPINQGGAMRVYFAAVPHDPVKAGAPPAAAECNAREQDRFVAISMLDVIDGKVAKDCLQFRTLYIGAHTISAVPDDYPVPNSADRKMWGVEIWANAAQSIFTNRYPVPNEGFGPTLIQALVLTVLGMFLVVRFRLAGFLGALFLLAVYSFAKIALFLFAVDSPIGDGPVAIPSIAYFSPAIFWWVVVLGYLLVEEQLAVARTKATFGRFVTASVARTILEREDAGGLELGGQMREITALFGDIRGFTTLSEGMDPPTLMGTLNRYFDGMVGIVERYEGTVNKYNGDNIMVIWNAPVDVQEHARKAVECALEIQKWIVNERSKGGPDISFGFGINTGRASAGFLGARGRMEYTVIGDAVNVASRITSNDIARRDQVACTKETLARLGADVVTVMLGTIFVKGRAEPVECYQVDRIGLLANPNPAPPPEIPIGRAAVAGFH
jgi:adenylate cyclase